MPKRFKVTDQHLILAIDPGKTDGFAMCGPEPEHNAAFEYSGNYDGFLEKLNVVYPDVIVYESFDHRQKDKVEMISAEHIGLIKWFAERRNVPIFEQTPSYGKAFFDNDKLKKLGLYIPGKPHAMDARRHLLQFKVKHNLFDMELLR